LGQIL